MKRKRKQYSGAFKAQVGLEAVMGIKTVAQLAREQPIRLVDLTFKTPLMDLDFQADLDHVTPESNKKFAAWALANDLAYLRTPRVRAAAPAGARP